jgi:glycosyltransferase involved in cell wall biosynthesis
VISPPPIVTVVTAVRNAAPVVARTIRSILAQSYPRIDYVVVDGCSTDGTVDVIRQFQRGIAQWVSAPPAGIADAFNRGVGLARGQYLIFVNAGDWLEPDHIETAVAILDSNPDKAFVFGDVIHYQDDRPLYLAKGSNNYRRPPRFTMSGLTHPGLLCRRTLFEAVGLFDTRYRSSMDFDWLVRVHAAGHEGLYTDRLHANMSLGGISDAQGLMALRENRIAAIRAGMDPLTCWCGYLVFAGRLRLRRLLERFVPMTVVIELRHVLFGSITPIRR